MTHPLRTIMHHWLPPNLITKPKSCHVEQESLALCSSYKYSLGLKESEGKVNIRRMGEGIILKL